MSYFSSYDRVWVGRRKLIFKAALQLYSVSFVMKATAGQLLLLKSFKHCLNSVWNFLFEVHWGFYKFDYHTKLKKGRILLSYFFKTLCFCRQSLHWTHQKTENILQKSCLNHLTSQDFTLLCRWTKWTCSSKVQNNCNVLVFHRHVPKMYETVFFESVN